jgi:hypothetical protein
VAEGVFLKLGIFGNLEKMEFFRKVMSMMTWKLHVRRCGRGGVEFYSGRSKVTD